MRPITPCLWFDGKAEEAARLYTSLFPNSHVDKVHRAPADFPSGKAGDVLTVDFTLIGTPFIALDGGPEFKFNEAVSFTVDCENQAEVDRYWSALLANGGEESVCGWLKDRFGVSWQIVPKRLNELLDGDDREGAKRAMEAMLGMVKLDVAQLEAAYKGQPVHA
jgi:predicted 3-demethylubiquinone-9 3-methyltransferase (glyoxalase superfamily)